MEREMGCSINLRTIRRGIRITLSKKDKVKAKIYNITFYKHNIANLP